MAAREHPDDTHQIEHEDPAAYDVFSSTCPSRPTLEHVTGRWGSLVLTALLDGPLRFNAVRRRVDGVSQKILAQTLQTLERDGFVNRTVLTTFPLHVEYELTPLGQTTAVKLRQLIDHIESQMPVVLSAQAAHDSRLPS